MNKIDSAVVSAIGIVVVTILLIVFMPMSVDNVLWVLGGALVLIAFCVGLSKQADPRTWNWILLFFNLVLLIGTKLVISAHAG